MKSRIRLTLALSAALMVTGCTASGGSSEGGSSSSTPAASATDMPATQDTPAPQVSTVEGPCPYLEQSFIEQTAGQKVSKTTVTTTTPPPGPLPRCEFHRSSGEPIAAVDSLTIAAGDGLAKSLELVPGGNPVNAGEGGSVMVHKGQAKTELAAFQGTTLVLVTINQESSLEAVEIAKQVLAAS